MIINTYYTGKLIHVGFLVQMKDLCPTIAYSLIMGVGVYALSLLTSSSLLQIIVGVVVGLPLYLGVSKLTQSRDYAFLMETLRQNVLSKWKKKK